MPNLFQKDPNAVLDYLIDWNSTEDGGPYLADGDTISTSTWIGPTVEAGTDEDPISLTVDDDTNTTTTATIWLSGGVVNCRYRLTNRIVTADGRTDDRSIFIDVLEQ